MSTDPLAEDSMFVAEELRDALAETTLSYGDRNRAAWALVDWLAAHDAQVRADERQKVVALLREQREGIAAAIEALPGPGEVGIKRWPVMAQENYLLAIEEAATAARTFGGER